MSLTSRRTNLLTRSWIHDLLSGASAIDDLEASLNEWWLVARLAQAGLFTFHITLVREPFSAYLGAPPARAGPCGMCFIAVKPWIAVSSPHTALRRVRSAPEGLYGNRVTRGRQGETFYGRNRSIRLVLLNPQMAGHPDSYAQCSPCNNSSAYVIQVEEQDIICSRATDTVWKVPSM